MCYPHVILLTTLQKPHPIFIRKGDDLHATIDIDLYDSLCGWEKRFTSICGKDIRVKNDTLTKPGWQECYAGLGMPKKRSDDRGDLYVGVNIIYPPALSAEKKMALREILRG